MGILIFSLGLAAFQLGLALILTQRTFYLIFPRGGLAYIFWPLMFLVWFCSGTLLFLFALLLRLFFGIRMFPIFMPRDFAAL